MTCCTFANFIPSVVGSSTEIARGSLYYEIVAPKESTRIKISMETIARWMHDSFDILHQMLLPMHALLS